jgi:hypothetical protein
MKKLKSLWKSFVAYANREATNTGPDYPRMPYGPGVKAHSEYVASQLQSIRIAEVKPGDTIVVCLPRIDIMDKEQSEKVEKSIRDELKMPEGVNVAVFFGQVDIYHLRKI